MWLPHEWILRARVLALYWLAVAILLAAAALAMWGLIHVVLQVQGWVRDAVWVSEPLGIVIPPHRTGLKGADLIIEYGLSWVRWFIDQFSVGGAYIIAGGVVYVVGMILLVVCETEEKRQAAVSQAKRKAY